MKNLLALRQHILHAIENDVIIASGLRDRQPLNTDLWQMWHLNIQLISDDHSQWFGDKKIIISLSTEVTPISLVTQNSKDSLSITKGISARTLQSSEDIYAIQLCTSMLFQWDSEHKTPLLTSWFYISFAPTHRFQKTWWTQSSSILT